MRRRGPGNRPSIDLFGSIKVLGRDQSEASGVSALDWRLDPPGANTQFGPVPANRAPPAYPLCQTLVVSHQSPEAPRNAGFAFLTTGAW